MSEGKSVAAHTTTLYETMEVSLHWFLPYELVGGEWSSVHPDQSVHRVRAPLSWMVAAIYYTSTRFCI